MKIEIPELCLVMIMGASGSGKTTFSNRFFKSTQVLSSDYFRGMISDDENDQSISKQAFESLFYIADQRLKLGKLTVIDATNLQKEDRRPVLNLAKKQNCLAVAIVLDMPETLCKERNQSRGDRHVKEAVISRQVKQVRSSLRSLQKEGFRYVHVIKTPQELEDLQISLTPLWNNKKNEHGPFDIIGDIHGCYDELCLLLDKLGYRVNVEDCNAVPPEGRKALFVGDICDRGPKNVQAISMVMNMVQSGYAHCVLGNHDSKLLKKLNGRNVEMKHGLSETFEQISAQGQEFMDRVKEFLNSLISHYVLDDGRLVLAHAGIKEEYQGRSSARVRDFCMYGDTTGEVDEYGLPIRLPWADEYRGRACVVYGHTPTPEVLAVNHTFCIDTGCVFGGKLSALTYPEKEIVQVSALKVYYEPIRPLIPVATQKDDLLNIKDVLKRRYIQTKLYNNVKINEENSIAALEVMSRFAADPHWLIYLPPTMSPCETAVSEDYLEYPTQAFEYYQKNGVKKLVCEEKHMGSRAVIVLCKNSEVAKSRFKVSDEDFGIIYTRTGRHFFEDDALQTQILNRLLKVLERTGFWDAFQTDWVCLDVELMPWSAKAQGLIASQYAPVGCAGQNALKRSICVLEEALKTQRKLGNSLQEKDSIVDLNALLHRYSDRASAVDHYVQAYQRYCWDVLSVDDYRIAPFHILATEGRVYHSQTHGWHMDQIKEYMSGVDEIFIATNHIIVDLEDESSMDQATKWWEELTSKGGEGMVVKPWDFISKKDGKLLQPAVKCRGKEYLRIIYGPEYLLGDNLERLKKRSLSKKRGLALSEFALGMEALERFVECEPLHRVHECVFGVLAMESEAVDPRL